ncbi:hypothetical protein JFN93_12100 [Geomonas sp. Red875]|uniref:Peptidase C51 domain-containing protein n=2 Tax=Geomesophilobacter sediminis TaxID=2798584 RepID=A0A8J7JDV6_9BACT|nr:hypothetical protein [Geomesophilobacter sediminis]
MPALKNTTVPNVTEGDVAVFRIKNYWHVAYVEKVHRNLLREPVSIDVSEMNYGGDLSYSEFKATWKSRSKREWKRAAYCCGITDNYGEVTRRDHVDLDTVTQVWSPDDVDSEGYQERFKDLVDRARRVINRFKDLTESEL